MAVGFNAGGLIGSVLGDGVYVAAGRSTVFAVDAATSVVVLGGVVAVASAIEDVAGYSLIQRSATDDIRGRVMSTFSDVGLIANAVAFAMAGSIVEAFGPRAVFLLGRLVSPSCLPLLGRIFRDRDHAVSRTPIED